VSHDPDKIDLDVAGTRNSLMAVSLEVEEKHAPWFDDAWGIVSEARAAR
jgi:hypothetical protein